ncbi:hypothetical protein T06_3762 [Trichinella sp. T6]|nr:hypothetical protein T06_3762 [Trichinella sp. T6]
MISRICLCQTLFAFLVTSHMLVKLNRRRNCLKGRMNRVCQDLEALIRQPESRIDVKMTLDSISKLLERCQEA